MHGTRNLSPCPTINIQQNELIAFGDAENDIEMIEFAGKGVAMGNAV
ncbi:HAD hydrolase family protein [Virgibacillus sp. FSP13]